MTSTAAPFSAVHTELSPHDAAAVLWHFGLPGGRDPGRFLQSLLTTIAHADLVNRALLHQSFPDLVDAFDAVANTPEGVGELSRIAFLAS
ncbi:MAG: hypothetical protein WKF57_03850 [Nakamurella sp.]